MEDSRLIRFTLYGWINYRRFKGASAICAILLNIILFILKLTVCVGIILLLSPHLIASKLRNMEKRSSLNKIFYVLMCAVSLATDIPALLIAVAFVLGGVHCVITGQLSTGLVMCIAGAFLGIWTLKCICLLFDRHNPTDELVDDEEEADTEDIEASEYEECEEGEDDDLRFCQLFTLGEDMCLLIDHVEMCPDETAFIRVAGEEGYTPIYKRRVKRDKDGGRFVVFNGYNYYLDDSKTQPIVPKK